MLDNIEAALEKPSETPSEKEKALSQELELVKQVLANMQTIKARVVANTSAIEKLRSEMAPSPKPKEIKAPSKPKKQQSVQLALAKDFLEKVGRDVWFTPKALAEATNSRLHVIGALVTRCREELGYTIENERLYLKENDPLAAARLKPGRSRYRWTAKGKPIGRNKVLRVLNMRGRKDYVCKGKIKDVFKISNKLAAYALDAAGVQPVVKAERHGQQTYYRKSDVEQALRKAKLI